ncbi:MAG: hypothetical protein DRO39_09715 [Thermoprotei archaeon]|nr:MAG: hypothetical protein DRO39_09715 [Thermoprotei archaeon]
MPMLRERVVGAVLGFVVGNAFGLPYEFMSREEVAGRLSSEMTGGGVHGQPPGTWGEDSSIMLAVLDAVAEHGLSLEAIAKNLVSWFREGVYTARGEVFDISTGVHMALRSLEEGVPPQSSGAEGVAENTALAPALPVAIYMHRDPPEDLVNAISRVVSVIQRDPRCIASAAIYALVLRNVVLGRERRESVELGVREAQTVLAPMGEGLREALEALSGVLVLGEGGLDEVTSHVVTTLERVLRVFAASPSFREAVMRAVEMGGDTDTAAALVGGLWGAYGGVGSIPLGWLERLARRSWVEELTEKLWVAVRRRYGL